MKRTPIDLCPCGSKVPRSGCCGPLLAEQRAAVTAIELMRSRYTAYVRNRTDYLLASWHASTRPAVLDLDSSAAGQWLGLKILQSQAGGPEDQEGTVEFVARFKGHGRAERLHERSRFVRENGRWFYVDGVLEKRE